MAEVKTNPIGGTTQVIDAEIIETPSVKKVEVSNEGTREVMPTLQLIKDGDVQLASLSEAEKEKYRKLSTSLVMSDINSVANYGSDIQSVLNASSHEYLKSTRTSKVGELGELMTNVLDELDSIDVGDIKPSKFVSLIRQIPGVRLLAHSYNKKLHRINDVEKNIGILTDKMRVTRLQAQRDNNVLSVQFDNNVQYLKHLEQLIIAGKLKLEELKAELAHMNEHPENYDAYQIQDYQEFINTLDMKINDMLQLHYATKLSLPQIRAVQYNNIGLANRANSIISTTIPLWRSQMAFAISLANQSNAIKAQNAVTEATNELMRKNAQLLHENSVEVAKATERSVIDIETLKDTTNKLIETVREVKKIHEEGVAKRKAAEEEIMRLEQEMESNMTSIASESSRYLLK